MSFQVSHAFQSQGHIFHVNTVDFRFIPQSCKQSLTQTPKRRLGTSQWLESVAYFSSSLILFPEPAISLSCGGTRGQLRTGNCTRSTDLKNRTKNSTSRDIFSQRERISLLFLLLGQEETQALGTRFVVHMLECRGGVCWFESACTRCYFFVKFSEFHCVRVRIKLRVRTVMNNASDESRVSEMPFRAFWRTILQNFEGLENVIYKYSNGNTFPDIGYIFCLFHNILNQQLIIFTFSFVI